MTVAAIREVPMPSRIRALPRDELGRPIPWFVAELKDGTRDFRLAASERRYRALRDNLCWVCGQKRPKTMMFAIGPMCTLNRITAEPAGHVECVVYSAQVCPFMLRPQMQRRTSNLPDEEDLIAPPGLHQDGNPGGIILWTTRDFSTFRVPPPAPPGLLIQIGKPTAVVQWWREGRPATYEEALTLLDAGYARLQEQARLEYQPEAALTQLRRQYASARLLLPAKPAG